MDYSPIIDFWFREITPDYWWKKDSAFDQLIRDRFMAVHQAASRCELDGWRTQAQGKLAEIIVLDQFSRNIYRDQALAFACDGLALALAQEAITAGANQQLEPAMRAFLYMPFMHSESLIIHERAVKLFSEPDMNQANLAFELQHKTIIERFGRYPHRNALLNRESTDQELAFLRQPGSMF
ncbi:MAG: DUF924 family protein [Methylovulum sp.]